MRPANMFLVATVAGCVISCSKSNSSSGGNGGSLAFANRDYVGVMTELSRYFQKPIDIHFNADSTVYAYCLFNLQVNGTWLYLDSLEGKVIKIGTGNAGGISATVYIAATADTQVYNFSSDLSGVSGGSNGLAGNQFYFSGLKEAPTTPATLNPSFWRASGLFPDIDGIVFTTYNYDGVTGGNVTEYYENGNYLNTGPQGIPKGVPYNFPYLQIGSRVYFNGYESASPELFVGLSYFGVIMPDGDTIMADTRSPEATYPIPGENGSGETPQMIKKARAQQQQCSIGGYVYGAENVSIAYNPDTTFSETQLGSLDVKYQYAGDSVVMVTYSNATAVGKVAVTKNGIGQATNIQASVLNPDGSVSSWQSYAISYSGKQVTKVQRTSSVTNDSYNGEYDYTYSSGNLMSIAFDQQTTMKFTYDALTAYEPGDLFWQEADIDLPLTYQAPDTYSPLLYPVSNTNICTGINSLVATYVYDNTGKITSANINGASVTYQYNCPN